MPDIAKIAKMFGGTTALSSHESTPKTQPKSEKEYREWLKSNGITDADSPESFYDYKSAFNAGASRDKSGHWPSDFKKPGHPNEVVGGFNTRTGDRVKGTPMSSEAELVRLGWDPETAKDLVSRNTPDIDKILKMFGGTSSLSSHAPKTPVEPSEPDSPRMLLRPLPKQIGPRPALPPDAPDSPERRIIDFAQGLLGIKQEPGQTASGYGALLGAAIPVVGGLRALRGTKTALTAETALSAAESAAIKKAFRENAATTAEQGITAYGSAPAIISREPAKALGTLANTIERGTKSKDYVLKPQVVDRLKFFLDRGNALPSQANWDGPSKELIDSFGGDEGKALLWSRLWGATSPNTSVPRNTQESLSALLYRLEHPNELLTKQIARGDTIGTKITMAGSKVPNINLAYQYLPLGSPKADAMAEFMVGNDRIPIDVHALFGLGSKQRVLSPELPGLRAVMTKREGLPLRGSLSEHDIYRRYETAIANALRPLDPERTLNPIFASTWEGIRDYKGLKAQGGPVDILRAKGLLEYGAMLDPERLRAALKTAKWSVGAIAGLMASLPRQQDGK